jgi:tRNA A37 threonylcarbamoyladenosine biosynthesis protein TsaE
VRTLVHADLYRLESLGEVADLGITELIEDGGVALVEWGDVAADAFGDDWLSLRFEILGEEQRRITIGGSGCTWSDRREPLVLALDAASRRAPADR